MPTSTKSRYTSSNAYRLAADRPARRTYLEDPVITPPRTVDQRMVRKAEERQKARAANKANLHRMLKISAALLGIFVICCTLIYRYAIILEANDTISKLQKDYSAVVAQNQSIETKLAKTFESSALERIATQELGMVKPDASQIIYVDMELRDTSEGAASGDASEQEQAALMGTPGTLIRAFQMLK